MKYELANALRVAGFPQRHPVNHHLGGTFLYKDGDISYHETGESDECYVPTLSELIEACGISDFKSLDNTSVFTDVEILNEWVAESFSGKMGSGPSPEEATGMLWLALNKP